MKKYKKSMYITYSNGARTHVCIFVDNRPAINKFDFRGGLRLPFAMDRAQEGKYYWRYVLRSLPDYSYLHLNHHLERIMRHISSVYYDHIES